MSARLIISLNSSHPFAVFRLSVTPRLFVLSIAMGNEALPLTLARMREGSPLIGSILMTSAPAFAIKNVAYGPW